ncbi:UNVERIFIED_CONTAM: hypothetical protein Sradi_2079700 [Sesamum radiatum]|uniref:Myb/SANT-like domain-containing protein n=1 Tax=Sesamum radiatum TaxID=300843 RepID=A0AAW2TJ00_SESRA
MHLCNDEGTSKARGCRDKSDKENSRRTWTHGEEEVLVNALRTIITKGWKSQDGFRSGYLSQLESIMCKHFPNTDIRAGPHINSKIHVWKKYYRTLSGMMSKSGIGWDDSRCMVTVDSEDVWDEYCKIDPIARTMRYKTWPFYPAWREIFSKDRVTGWVTVDANKKVSAPNTITENDNHDCYAPSAEWYPDVGYVGNDKGVIRDHQVNFDPNITPATSNKKSPSSAKKRKAPADVQDDDLVNAVRTFCDSANARLGELIKKLTGDFEEVEKRSAVYEAVGKVPGIDLNDQIIISNRLVDNSKKMDLFFSLLNDARARMVELMLKGKM